jgi:hypothetical protein
MPRIKISTDDGFTFLFGFAMKNVRDITPALKDRMVTIWGKKTYRQFNLRVRSVGKNGPVRCPLSRINFFGTVYCE